MVEVKGERSACLRPPRQWGGIRDYKLEAKSDVELEWQRRRFRVRSCRQDFTDKIGEPQRDRQAVGKGGAVEIQLRQRHQIRKDGFYRAIAARDIHGQRIGNLATRIGSKTRDEANRPKIGHALGDDGRRSPQDGPAAIAEKLDLVLPPDLDSDEFRRWRHGAREAGPFVIVEPHLPVNEKLARRLAVLRGIGLDDHLHQFGGLRLRKVKGIVGG